MTTQPDPAPERRPYEWGLAGGLSIAMLVLDVAGMLALAALLELFRSRFREVFAQLGVELPVLTRLLLGVPAAAWLLAALLVSAFLVLKEVLLRGAAARLALNFAAGFSAMVIYCLGLSALFLPLVEIQRALAR